MTSRTRTYRLPRIAVVLAAIGIVGASVVAAPLSAHADPTISWEVSTLSVEYGSPWSATATVGPDSLCSTSSGPGDPWCLVTVDYTGTASGSFTTTMYPSGVGTSNLYLDPTLGGSIDSFLGVGGYRFVVTYAPIFADAPAYTVTSPPFQLTVTEAALTTSVMVTADPLTARNAVVSVNQSGGFVDNLGWYFSTGMPAGAWGITIIDQDGAEVFRQELPGEEGGPPYLVVPWTDVPPGTTFSATASFEVTGSAAANFTTLEGDASFTSATPAPTPTPTPTPLPSASAPTGLAVPVWLLVVFGLVLLGGAAAIVVLLVRRRRTAQPLEEGTADAE